MTHKNEDERRLYKRDWDAKKRQELVDYLGAKCVQCGATDNLEFDHIDPETKKFNVPSHKIKAKLSGEIDKCQLLCCTCHKAKTLEQVSVPHGGGLSGKKNCKCDLCRERKNEYMRNWKRKNKISG